MDDHQRKEFINSVLKFVISEVLEEVKDEIKRELSNNLTQKIVKKKEVKNWINREDQYHEWMKSEELQQLTASEPLSLAEEYEMQKSWREDDDKCTFITLDKELFEKTNDEIKSMIGDTNIFLTDKDQAQGEIEIMIAEKSARGKKMGWETVILMLLYGIEYINLKKYEAKISLSNEKSIKMFYKLGFEEQSRSEVFQEVTLYKEISTEWTTWLKEQCGYKIEKYD